MRRNRWTWGVGLAGLCAVVAGVTSAQDGEAGISREDAGLVEAGRVEAGRVEAGLVEAGLVDAGRVDAAGPRLEIELGRSPTQVGFAVRIAGGAPHARALLSLSTAGGAAARSFVALDERGEARIVQRNASPASGIRVACAIPRPGASPSRVAVRTATFDLDAPPAAVALAAPGDVVICEIMKDPQFVSDSAGEWFELRNRSTQPIDLEGWTISDAGSNSHVIQNGGNGLWLQPRQYLVLGANADPNLNGGIHVHYRYSNFTLANGADEIRLGDASGNLVDVVAYDDGIFWPDEAGKSLSLSRSRIDATLNDDGANWCSALSPIPNSFDFGTPRLANNNCP
jgi:hypothetical protein